eukprot:403336329
MELQEQKKKEEEQERIRNQYAETEWICEPCNRGKGTLNLIIYDDILSSYCYVPRYGIANAQDAKNSNTIQETINVKTSPVQMIARLLQNNQVIQIGRVLMKDRTAVSIAIIKQIEKKLVDMQIVENVISLTSVILKKSAFIVMLLNLNNINKLAKIKNITKIQLQA